MRTVNTARPVADFAASSTLAHKSEFQWTMCSWSATSRDDDDDGGGSVFLSLQYNIFKLIALMITRRMRLISGGDDGGWDDHDDDNDDGYNIIYSS